MRTMHAIEVDILLEELSILIEYYQYEAERAEREKIHNPINDRFFQDKVKWLTDIKERIETGQWSRSAYKYIIQQSKRKYAEEYEELQRLSRKFGFELVPKT